MCPIARIYSEATMTDLDEKDVWWVGRVPETSTQAKGLVAGEPATWQGNEELRWVEREVTIGDSNRALDPRTERRRGGTAGSHLPTTSGAGSPTLEQASARAGAAHVRL